MDRKEILIKIKSLDEVAKVSQSQIICRRLLSVIEEASDVEDFLCFYPMSTEPDIRPVFSELLARGKRLYFPVMKEECTMDFYRVDFLDDFHEAAYHVMEPNNQRNDRLFVPVNRSLCFTPGVIFDRHGNRIGHGKGYYDRYFAKYGDRIIKVGVGYDVQLLDYVDAKPWDIQLDTVITNEL